MLALVMMFVVVLLIHNINVLANAVAGLALFIFVASGHPVHRLLLYSSPFVLLFVSTSTGMMMFGEGTTTWFRYGLIHVTEESFFRGLHLGFRALSFAFAGLLFGLTTKPVLLFYSLMQQCKVPAKYAYAFLAAFRLLPIMLEEFQALRYAIKIRGRRPKRGFSRFYETMRMYAVPLMAQSIRRAQRTAVAMEAKRFRSEQTRTYFYHVGFSAHDVWFAVIFTVIFAAAYWTGTEWPYISITDVRLK
nr:energy-coupling factor transporter transmembrane component T [Paenibacillus turpanensis]